MKTHICHAFIYIPWWATALNSLIGLKILPHSALVKRYLGQLATGSSVYHFLPVLVCLGLHHMIRLHDTHTQRQTDKKRETERNICYWCSSNGKAHRICYHLLHVLMYENKGYQRVTYSCCARAHWNTGLWRSLYVCLHVCLCVGECVSKISERDFSLPLSK